jgi:glycosyltransferase involved in cell wall biosynthesis
MRILIFHGYLLAGTGSNVYNAKLAEALAGLGHEVHLLCQDRSPQRLPFVDATADWDNERLVVRARREPVRCTVYRPDIGPILPVYVADRYEGIAARRFADCTDAQIALYVQRNVEAVREVAAAVHPDVALANHLVMGPLILARALAGAGVPYAVKVHGSALEYTVKPHPERFRAPAREGVARASGVLVGSRHTAESLWAALDDPQLPDRTRLGPPGVDVAEFTPRDQPAAAAGLHALAQRLALERSEPGEASGDAFARDSGEAARALAALDPSRDRLVAFVGKLIVAKGVDLLLAAWPLVLAEVPEARLVVIGFGAYRQGFTRLRDALAAGNFEDARWIADQGTALEGGPPGKLRRLREFLDALEGTELERYHAAAAGLHDQVVMTGRLEHSELADVLPACEALVVPSTFPESFGMVAVEAAACGALPISADHSGLAEVTQALAAEVPPAAAGWLSFGLGPGSVHAIADRVTAWLRAPGQLRETTRAALVSATRARFSWQGVARGVLAAAEGRLDGLVMPGGASGSRSQEPAPRSQK